MDQIVSPDSGGVLTSKHSHTVLVYDLQEAGILPNIGSALLGSSYWSSPLDFQREIEVHRVVVKSGLPNYIGCKIPVFSSLKISKWRIRLNNFPDKQLVDFLEFGWPIGYNSQYWPLTTFKNHKGAVDYSADVSKYIIKEVSLGATLGPFKYNPLCTPLCISPINTVPKGKDDRRVICDLSFPHNASVNSGIPKEAYLGTVVILSFPTVDTIAKLVREKGKNCHIFKRDLSRAYRQFPVDPRDICFLGSTWGSRVFIDRVSVMGLRTGALMCQRTTSGVAFIMKEEGYSCVNYQDDFLGVEIPTISEEAFLVLGNILHELG